MSEDNYDDLADFCGPKDFYDLDGDGHLDAFEAAMMASDVEDELTVKRAAQGQLHTPAAVLLTQQAHAGAAGVRLLVYVYRSRCACYGVVVGGKDIFLRQSVAASPPA